MLCEYSANCIYYKTYRDKPNAKQFYLLIESYCEGRLQSMCRRLRYEAEFCKEPPNELAPNGYVGGTHKKLRTDNIRKFERYKINNGSCMLQVLNTRKTFSAGIIDISEGGMRLELSVHPDELNVCSEKSLLKVLGHNLEESPVPMTKDVVKMVWQNNRIIGCSFADPLLHL